MKVSSSFNVSNERNIAYVDFQCTHGCTHKTGRQIMYIKPPTLAIYTEQCGPMLWFVTQHALCHHLMNCLCA